MHTSDAFAKKHFIYHYFSKNTAILNCTKMLNKSTASAASKISFWALT